MRKLIRFLKPYAGAILAAVVLLFVQANLELALPDYLSRIVTVGIQQGGVESAIPEQVSPASFERWVSSLEGDVAESVAAAYERDGDRWKLEPGAGAALETNPTVITAFATAVGLPLPPGLEDAVLAQAGMRAVTMEYETLGIEAEATRMGYIYRNGATMLLITLGGAIAAIGVGYLSARSAAGFARDIRSAVFRSVENFSGQEFDQFSTASLITRTTNDVTQVQQLVFFVIQLMVYAPILGIGGIIRAVGKAPSMAWLIGLAVLVLLAFVGVVMAIAIPRFKRIQKLTDRLNLVAREILSGLMVVRAFNRQDFEEQRFDNANLDVTANNRFVIRTMATVMPAIMLIMNGLAAAVIWLGADRIAASTMNVGDMMAFLQYAMQIVTAFLMMSMMFIFIPRASVSAERIGEVLGTEPSIRDPEDPVPPAKEGGGRVEFKDVSFRYPGAEDNAICGVSFSVGPGETLAIIGSTGSGKSTVANLIPRFYDVREGSVEVGGIDIRRMTRHDLREQIGYVPQKSILFSGTVATNLQMADPDAPTERLRSAAAIAQADGFVGEMEGGYEAEVSQGGTNVSGGQRQRLAIARALVKPYPVYVFDDSFSALDFRTDRALRTALKEVTRDSAVIIVAQRVSTIMRADRILVLEDGEVAGLGTHAELMATCTPYREIAVSQLGEEADR
jgi:ATP-binding cassette subfamily B multidrug efflux pump